MQPSDENISASSVVTFDSTDADVAAARASAHRARRAARVLSSGPQAYIDFLEAIARTYLNPLAPSDRTPLDEATPLILSIADATAIERPDWLIDQIIPSNSLCFLYGREGVGKSFTALDWAFSIASGRAWFNRLVRQGPVLYCTAEGVWGLGNRVRGYLQERDPTQSLSTAQLHLLPQSLALHTDEGQRQLLLALRDILPDIPVLVIIDTLHAYTAGADENSGKDMGAVLSFANNLRTLTGCAIILVHHARKNVALGGGNYRGHSSLAGAADAMIHCRKQGTNVVTYDCEKQKDGPPFEQFSLALKPIALPDGESTCVLVEPSAAQLVLGGQSVQSIAAKAPRGRRGLLFALLALAPQGMSYADLKSRWISVTGKPGASFDQDHYRLSKAGRIAKNQSGLWTIVSEPDIPAPTPSTGESDEAAA